MVPERWRELALENVVSTSITYGVVQPGEAEDGGVPFIRGGDFPDGRVLIDRLRTISPAISAAYKRTVLRGDELLVSLVGYPGATAIVPKALIGANIARQAALVRPNNAADRAYLFHYLSSQIGQKRMLAKSLGSAQQVINLRDLKEVAVLLPPLPEQKKIAEILSTWDKAIETTEKLLANAEAQKRALMQQLLTGKRRLKGFEGTKWKSVAVGRMGKVFGGGTPDSQVLEYWGGEIAWATPTDITRLGQRFIRVTERTITKSGLKNSSANVLPSGSLLVCTRATVGELAIAAGEIATNQGFKSIVPGKGYDVEFLYYLFAFHKHEFVRYACGSTFLELSKRDFEKRSFYVPNEDEQIAIAGIMNNASRVIEGHRRRIEALRNEKRALMQQLLTGKRRVTV